MKRFEPKYCPETNALAIFFDVFSSRAVRRCKRSISTRSIAFVSLVRSSFEMFAFSYFVSLDRLCNEPDWSKWSKKRQKRFWMPLKTHWQKIRVCSLSTVKIHVQPGCSSCRSSSLISRGRNSFVNGFISEVNCWKSFMSSKSIDGSISLPLTRIDSSKHREMFDQVVEHERMLQTKLNDFIQQINQQWAMKLKNDNLLHLDEPLLRKEKAYYFVNIKKEVRVWLRSLF